MTSQPVAIITGASRGIGEATAIRFAQKGYHVTLIARTQSLLDQLARKLEAEHNVQTLCCAGDLADLAFCEQAIEQTVAKWGRIDVLVNNAVWREVVTMRDITVESFEKTMRIGVTAPAFMSRWAAQTMEKQKRGVIINISSVMAQQAAGIFPAYVASKGAMDSLTYELATLYGPSNVRVIGISPGAIDTERSRELNQQPQSDNDPVRAFSEDMIMLRRWGTSQEVARFIVALAGEDASYLTGTIVTLDGGWRHQHMPRSLRRQIRPQDFA